MRSLTFLCIFFAAPVIAQDASGLGKSAVSAVVDRYTINTLVRVPGTNKPLPSDGKWSMETARPDRCPHDDTACARVVYSVPQAHVVCEWTVVPAHDAEPAAFLDQNEDASRYLLQKLPSAEVAALVVKSPQPVYPPIALAAHASGPVTVRIVVSEKGTVMEARAVSGQAMLQTAAMIAAQHWTFHPFMVGAQPASFTADLIANFILDSKAARCTKDNPCAAPPAGTATIGP